MAHINIIYQRLSETQMLVWYMGPYSMSWCPTVRHKKVGCGLAWLPMSEVLLHAPPKIGFLFML